MNDINDMNGSTFGELLTMLRKQRRMNQQDLANKLDVHRNTVSKWERGACLPESKTMVLELARQLRLDTHDSRRLLEASLTAISPYWYIPHQRNPFFTGREEILHQVYDTLSHERTAVLSQSYTLSGLGGIGKTQTALEFAYRYADEYTAIFWISAETRESILASYVAIAAVLNLPERQEQDQEKVVAAVTRWLTTHSDWLIIFDNVEDPLLVKNVLPAARFGSLLFTSRRQALGIEAQVLTLGQMTPEEGIHFLLHRARRLDPTAPLASLPPGEKTYAQEIVTVMDGLPLALDQAGAYIEATQCSLSDYLRLFRTAQHRLLDAHEEAASNHPLSVSRTFVLAFERVEQCNPLAADLLTICAFLAPDAIPEMVFLEGASLLGPRFEALAMDPLAFSEAIKVLLSYSLIQRHDAIHTITVHRLVQAVLTGQLTADARHIWTRRVIEVMSKLFPLSEGTQDYWPVCEQLLPHAQRCLLLDDQWSKDEALCLPLMNHVATYLYKRARYTEAEQLFKRSIQIGELALGLQHPLVAEALHGLAEIYQDRGKYDEAESLLVRAVHIREQVQGDKHPLVAISLARLGILYWQQGKYKQAEPCYQRALHIREQALGSEHPQIASLLTNLGILYWQQGKYEQVEPLFQRSLHIQERALGSEHTQIAYTLTNLGVIYSEQGKYKQAEPLFQRALHIREHILGSEHPQLAYPLTNLGELYFNLGEYKQAEPLFQRALHIREQALGSEHPEVSWPLHGLANLYREQGKYDQAKSLYQRALAIRQQHLDSQHPEIADILYDLARFHHVQQHTAEALSLYQQALTIREQALGLDHPKTSQARKDYVHVLQELGRIDEAEHLSPSR